MKLYPNTSLVNQKVGEGDFSQPVGLTGYKVKSLKKVFHLTLNNPAMRTSIMTTYKELMAVKNDTRWASNQPAITPDPMVMEYTEKHGRREGLLYNNRIFF